MFPKSNYVKNQNLNSLSLYVHWPYCESKCPYCDFNSHLTETINNKDWITSYINQLNEMKKFLDLYNIEFKNLDTIFFGGGTPSLMPLEILDNVINTAAEIFSFSKNIEISLEANPSSFDINKFKRMRQIGVNRISLGVQSLKNKNLKFLGRKHSYLECEKAIEAALINFNNVSIDLIYALYNQTIKDWLSELKTVLNKFDLQHISLYQLTIEEGTKFFSDFKKGKIKIIDNDTAFELFNITNSVLSDYGYKRYEVSNFAKKGFESKHNLNYWTSENWIGIGPGAYGRLWHKNQNSKRIEIKNFRNPKTWLYKNAQSANFEDIKVLDNHQTDIDTLLMGLRLDKGIKINKLNNRNLVNNEKFLDLEKKGFIVKRNGNIKIKKNHIAKLNSIVDYLLY